MRGVRGALHPERPEVTDAVAARTGQAAVDYAESRVGSAMPDSGLCLQMVRQNFAIPSYYYAAIDAWNGADDRHPSDRNPPPAVGVWFDSTSIYGHVAFHVGAGRVITTFNAEIRAYPSIAAMESVYGPFMGWASDLNEQWVHDPRPTPPPIEEDDMPFPMFLRKKDGGIAIINGEGARALTSDHWQVWKNLGYTITHDEMDPGPFQALIDDMGGWQ